MALPPKVYQFLVSVFASLGSFLFGYDLGVIAEAIASENFVRNFGNDPNELSVLKKHPKNNILLTIMQRCCRFNLHRRRLFWCHVRRSDR